MPRKTRSDSKLASLPPEQRAALVAWLVDENLSYQEAKDKLLEEFGLETSVGALANFYSTHCWRLAFEKARSLADSLDDVLPAETFDRKILAGVKQQAFEMIASRATNVDDLSKLVRIIGESAKLALRKDQLALDERKVQLLEAKAAAYDNAKDIYDSQLTDEEKAARWRRIFGQS